MINELKADN